MSDSEFEEYVKDLAMHACGKGSLKKVPPVLFVQQEEVVIPMGLDLSTPEKRLSLIQLVQGLRRNGNMLAFAAYSPTRDLADRFSLLLFSGLQARLVTAPVIETAHSCILGNWENWEKPLPTALKALTVAPVEWN